ncbi:EG45-like domain containing protein [Cicer arietinum]|uniref:EG45-like domain containing protein n=1 Tax=Cicer arietinum TaxID=3827 RepID=A0A1S3E8B6_CICAR|nr:EG45-like domain containing protein [Cicer arietinum]XP_027190928.1 EG45-like domain containing protein [Cicer arietinum]
MRLFTLLILSIILLNQLSLILADLGTASSYGPPYIPTACDGNRREQFPPGNIFAAVNEGLWDNGAACGRRYRIRCLSGINKPCKDGSIDVKIVDIISCSKHPCFQTFLLSTQAFAAISRFPNANINIEYMQI